MDRPATKPIKKPPTSLLTLLSDFLAPVGFIVALVTVVFQEDPQYPPVLLAVILFTVTMASWLRDLKTPLLRYVLIVLTTLAAAMVSLVLNEKLALFFLIAFLLEIIIFGILLIRNLVQRKIVRVYKP